MSVHLNGMAWSHPRGYAPMVATSREYQASHPGVRISWEKRSLQDFEHYPLDQLAEAYDLIVIDHPHVGEAARGGYLLPFDGAGFGDELDELASQSVAGSHESYRFGDRQWALAIDAAAQVSAYRPGSLAEVPTRWPEVLEVASEGRTLWPLAPVHALSSFLSLSANRGTPCAQSEERLMDPEDGRVVLEAMLAVKGHVPDECLSMDPIQALDLLSSDGSYDYAPMVYGYSNYARDDFAGATIEFADLPALGDDGPIGSQLGGTGIAVSSRCEATEEARAYALWVAGADCQSGIYFDSGGQPGNLEAWLSDAVNKASRDFFRATLDTLRGSWLRPRYDGYLYFQRVGGGLVNDCLAGRSPVDETLDGLEAAYQESLAKGPGPKTGGP